jgi:hypothetical protein
MFRSKKFYYTVFCVGGGFEILGYIVRIISRSNVSSVTLYAIQTFFILVAPCLFSASIYMTLGRLLVYVQQPQVSPVPVKLMTKIFVFGDILSLMLQGAGGGIESGAKTVQQHQTGSDIVVGGLGVQLLFYGGFVVVCIICHRRLLSVYPNQKFKYEQNWHQLILALYFSSVLILIRSVYRISEFAQGFQGYIITHEVFMFIFDSCLMFMVMVTFLVIRPGDVMSQKHDEEFVDLDGLDSDESKVVSNP